MTLFSKCIIDTKLAILKYQSLLRQFRTLSILFTKNFWETQRWKAFVISRSASFVEQAVHYRHSWSWVYRITYTNISHCAKNFGEMQMKNHCNKQVREFSWAGHSLRALVALALSHHARSSLRSLPVQLSTLQHFFIPCV